MGAASAPLPQATPAADDAAFVADATDTDGARLLTPCFLLPDNDGQLSYL